MKWYPQFRKDGIHYKTGRLKNNFEINGVSEKMIYPEKDKYRNMFLYINPYDQPRMNAYTNLNDNVKNFRKIQKNDNTFIPKYQIKYNTNYSDDNIYTSHLNKNEKNNITNKTSFIDLNNLICKLNYDEKVFELITYSNKKDHSNKIVYSNTSSIPNITNIKYLQRPIPLRYNMNDNIITKLNENTNNDQLPKNLSISSSTAFDKVNKPTQYLDRIIPKTRNIKK